MKPVVRNTLAVVAGVVVGSIVNSAIVNFGPMVIPLPEGADVSTMEGVRESMSLFTFKNFIPPFLAHALGTLVGAYLAARFAASRNRMLALVVGGLFFLGGITAAITVGGPTWFIAVDLILAYVPMALLGAHLAGASGSE